MVDKMATMMMRESSDFRSSSEEDLDLGLENIADTLDHGKYTVHSSNIIDMRLIKFYRLKRWREESKARKAQRIQFKLN